MTTVREIAERLGPVREVPRNTSGAQEILTLYPLQSGQAAHAAKAALTLAECGISLLMAKRAIERVIDEGEETLFLPLASTRQELSQSLEAAGFGVNFDAKVGSCQR